MIRTFRGGIRFPEEAVIPKGKPLSVAAPAFLTLSLCQSTGTAALPLVRVGDRVLKGQKIAEAGEGESVPLHAPVSGRVVSLETASFPKGDAPAILLENDYREELHPSVVPFSKPISRTNPEEIAEYLKEKGLVEGEGAPIPVWKKILRSLGRVESVLVNGLSCEPYLWVNHTVLAEYAKEVVGGAMILRWAVGASKVTFAVEKGCHDQEDALASEIGDRRGFFLTRLRSGYPKGEERLLVRSVFHREVPQGQGTESVGVVVFSAETLRAVYRCFVTGLPAVERPVFVGGDCIREPALLMAPLGISFRDLILSCGGYAKKPDRLLAGGAMTGTAQKSDAVALVKNTAAVVGLSDHPEVETACIRCGLCYRVCPVGLMPLELNRSVERNRYHRAGRLGIFACVECGCCTYSCPAKLPLLENIREGKKVLLSRENHGRGV